MKPAELIELLRLKEWNQAELARQLDMSEATVSRWLDGTRKPTGGTRKLLKSWLADARANRQLAGAGV